MNTLCSRIYSVIFLGLVTIAFPLSAQSIKKGIAAPDFTLTLSDGKQVSLSDYRGKALLLHFWATWCPPCRAELPGMNTLAENLAETGNKQMAFLAVCVSDKESERAAFMKKNGYSFSGGIDVTDTIAMNYQVQGIPMSVLINPDGIIENIHVGAMSPTQLSRFVRPYVK